MKFDINNYKGYYVMHCKTKVELNNFIEYLKANGLPTPYHNEKCYYGENVYYFNQPPCWSSMNYAKQEGYTILEWEDFMKHTFTKADLKTGDVILKRNGDVEIVIKEHNVLLRPRECNRLADLNYDLTHSFLRDGDVIAVRRPNTPTDCQFGAFKDKRGTLIYERQEVEEMTLEQVCKLLGREIKIIK